jgi:hypothetical protein
MSRNLFTNLLSLHVDKVPEEDFFTELIAWYLNKNNDVLFLWLKDVFGVDEKYTGICVETQVTFDRLEQHETGSRPDIMISLYYDDETDYVLIESKISSREGNLQLPRYAEHLAESLHDARKRYLLYITRDFDPKEAVLVTKETVDKVVFKQVRWHEFYGFLKKQESNLVLDEILEFMRSKNMAEINRITPATLAAFNSFPDVYNFLEKVLGEEVYKRFSEIFDPKLKPAIDACKWRGYALNHTTINWDYYLGFYLPDSLNDYPTLFASFNINTKSAKNAIELANVLQKIETDTKNAKLSWKGSDLKKANYESFIELKCFFNELLQEEDHISAMKEIFMSYLEETSRLLKDYPFLLT